MINILRALMNKVDNMPQQMAGCWRNMEIQRNNQKEMVEIKHTNVSEECL